MPEDATQIHDKQTLCLARFDRIVRQRLRAPVTDGLIAAHQRTPSGPHGDDLERLLNYFRRAAPAAFGRPITAARVCQERSATAWSVSDVSAM